MSPKFGNRLIVLPETLARRPPIKDTYQICLVPLRRQANRISGPQGCKIAVMSLRNPGVSMVRRGPPRFCEPGDGRRQN